jgi:glutamate dehydrogenase (NADP+)
MGKGVGPTEVGYLYGQYKRVDAHHGQIGKGLLWGGKSSYYVCIVYSVFMYIMYS